jgi:NAD-dependent DNA ligase
MFRELKKLESENPELVTPDSPTQRVGSLGTKFKTQKHKYKLYSLDNSNNYNELENWYERVTKEVGEGVTNSGFSDSSFLSSRNISSYSKSLNDGFSST